MRWEEMDEEMRGHVASHDWGFHRIAHPTHDVRVLEDRWSCTTCGEGQPRILMTMDASRVRELLDESTEGIVVM